MKKYGFTLIEMIVIVALLGILAIIFTPRLRDNLAKAEDAKAVSLLGVLRGTSEAGYAENGILPYGSVPNGENDFNSVDDLSISDKNGLDILREGLNNGAKKMLNGKYTVNIGGTRENIDGEVSYGEEIGFTFHAPAGKVADGVSLWFTERAIDTEDGRYDTKGKAWIEY